GRGWRAASSEAAPKHAFSRHVSALMASTANSETTTSNVEGSRIALIVPPVSMSVKTRRGLFSHDRHIHLPAPRLVQLDEIDVLPRADVDAAAAHGHPRRLAEQHRGREMRHRVLRALFDVTVSP